MTKLYHSDLLGINFFKRKNGNIRFEDGVEYSARERKIINHFKYSQEDLKQIHLVKNVFEGSKVVAHDPDKN